MKPFVELPLLLFASPVRFSQQRQLFPGPVQLSGPDQRGDVEPTDERPDAAVVVLVRKVQVSTAVVLAPIAVTRVDRWGERFKRVRPVGSRSVCMSQNRLRTVFISYTQDYRQAVTEAVEGVAELPETDTWQVLRRLLQGCGVLLQQEPFEAHRFQFLQLLAELMAIPGAVQPHQQVDLGGDVSCDGTVIRGAVPPCSELRHGAHRR